MVYYTIMVIMVFQWIYHGYYTILYYTVLYYTIMVNIIMVVIIYPDNKYSFRFFPNCRLKIGGLPRFITDNFLFIIITIWINL